jgi:glycosyltransferase involved in cell wall biosynthesis
MKVAVVTPYHKEALETLRRCHESVSRQSHPCTHIFVADGHPQDEVGSWPGVRHLRLPVSHRDYGNTPRALGSISAFNQGFDAVAYLDADNWYADDHIESLVEICTEHRVPVAFSARQIVLFTGELYPLLESAELEGVHIDTNCYLITQDAAWLASAWAMMDPSFAVVGDRLFRRMIDERIPRIAGSGRRTVFYVSRWPQHFEDMGISPPPGCHRPADVSQHKPYDRNVHLSRLGWDPFA